MIMDLSLASMQYCCFSVSGIMLPCSGLCSLFIMTSLPSHILFYLFLFILQYRATFVNTNIGSATSHNHATPHSPSGLEYSVVFFTTAILLMSLLALLHRIHMKVAQARRVEVGCMIKAQRKKLKLQYNIPVWLFIPRLTHGFNHAHCPAHII